MPWHGKPAGGYDMYSTEGTENIYMVHYALAAAGYTLEAQAGVIGNMVHESALNVWRWQSDTVNLLYGGYGLFQYTASSSAAVDRYIDVCSWVPGYAPNLSTSYITTGASLTDADAQMEVFINDYLDKWHSAVWRSYWPEDATLRGIVNSILTNWGDGSNLSQYAYSQITSVADAAVAFLGAFEGPATPNYHVRINSAVAAYDILAGAPPGPTPGNIPIWLLFKLRQNNFKGR